MNEDIKLERPRDFSETVNTLFSFAVKHIKPLSILFLTYAIVPVLLTGIVGSYFSISINGVNWQSYIEQIIQGGTFISPPNLESLILLIILSFIAQTFISGLVYEYLIVYKSNNGEKIKLIDVWYKFKNDAPALFGYQILLFLIFLFVSIILSLIFSILSNATFALILMIIIIIIPFLIFIYVPLRFILMVKVAEQRNFTYSINRCFQLVKNNWWITFGLIIIISLIVGIMGFAFALPSFIYSAIQGFLSIQNGSNVEINTFVNGIFTTISSIGSSWLSIILNLLIGIHFFSLREKADKNTLIQQIESIGNNSETEETL